MKSEDKVMEDRLNDFGGLVVGGLDDVVGLLRDVLRHFDKAPLPAEERAEIVRARDILVDSEARISEHVTEFDRSESLMSPEEFVARGMEIMGDDQ